MMFIAAVAANLVAFQGQAVELSVPHVPALEGVTMTWNEQRVPLVRRDGEWIGVVGIDLDTAAGPHAVLVERRFADGATMTRSETIDVRSKDYPTTELTVAPKYVELNDEDQARAARESREISALYARVTPEAYWSEPFVVPIPGIDGGRNFGHRRVFNGQARAPHSGADLRAATGTEIRATNAGRVVLAKNLFFSGNAVFIDHGLGVYSTYLHLSEFRVAVGDAVERGQVIGLAGATGRVTGPHLHWGVRALDARVDPFSLLSLGGAPSE